MGHVAIARLDCYCLVEFMFKTMAYYLRNFLVVMPWFVAVQSVLKELHAIFICC